MLKPAESESQTLRALLRMREMIVRGEFSPGERIREIPLSERLGVSRTPLRLVLERLEHEGLLEARPTVGFVVREFTIQDILDTIELRGVLEGTAARLAAERLVSNNELVAMRASIEETALLLRQRLDVVETLGRYAELNTRFHSEMIGLARSPMLKRSLERVLALPFASPNAFVASELESEDWYETLSISLWQHRVITEAIANHEGARAEAIAREHSRVARRIVTLALKSKRYEEIPGGTLIRA
ncbi:MAG TPA: GntR family transcriptional regulator [Bryobacteraceae bacterium]|nr:GntR family transcriptional regulator [Bryobacteraceae bacterium]